MDFSFSDINLQLDGRPPINFNSVETLQRFPSTRTPVSKKMLI